MKQIQKSIWIVTASILLGAILILVNGARQGAIYTLGLFCIYANSRFVAALMQKNFGNWFPFICCVVLVGNGLLTYFMHGQWLVLLLVWLPALAGLLIGLLFG